MSTVQEKPFPWETYEVKDSGKRQQNTTGSQRDTEEGKGRYDLLPLEALKRDALLLQKGAVKYGDRNWEKGMPFSRAASSMLRHTTQAIEDLKTGAFTEDHLAAIRFNAAVLMHHQEKIAKGELPASLNDLETTPTVPTSTSRSVRPLVYVAGPYRDNRGQWYVEKNIDEAREYAMQLWKAGFAVICPHANTYRMDGPVESQEFIDGDLVMISKCDAVVMMPRWRESEGSKQEEEFARSKGIQVFYADEVTTFDVVGRMKRILIDKADRV